MMNVQNTIYAGKPPTPENADAVDFYNALKRLPVGFYPTRLGVQNANSFANVMPDFLQPDALTQIVDSYASFRAFTTIYDPAPYAPKAQSQIKFVVGSGSPVQNPTTYETNSGDTINAVAVPVTHYSQQWYVTNTDYQKGIRLEDAFVSNMLQLNSTLASAVAALFTAGNFPATPISVAPTAFGLGDLASAYTTIKKTATKSAVIDGDFFARLSHTNGFDAATKFGWNGIYPQSAGWASAGSKVRGICRGPTAILLVTGRLFDNIAPNIKQSVFSLGDLGIVVEYSRWMNTGTRSYQASLDVVLGGAVADTTAGVLIQNP
jgi:hypothetical protein